MSAATAALRLGLVGSPNSGKTTLFNALTGLRARVGNYAGVTVERREGDVVLGARRAVVVDLPGLYSLDALSPDEEVVLRVLSGELAPPPDALVVVAIDAPPELARRLEALGFLPATEVSCRRRAPLGDPRVYELRGTQLCLRRSEAARIQVERR